MAIQRKVLLVGILLILSIITPLSVLGKKPEHRFVNNAFTGWTQTERVLPSGIVIVEGISYQTWWGDGWDGTVVQYVTMIIRTDDVGNLLITGHGKGEFTGTVDGKSGTVTYTINQIVPGGYMPDLKGTMTILKGTGELKGIKGHGILNFLGGGTDLYMHFKP